MISLIMVILVHYCVLGFFSIFMSLFINLGTSNQPLKSLETRHQNSISSFKFSSKKPLKNPQMNIYLCNPHHKFGNLCHTCCIETINSTQSHYSTCFQKGVGSKQIRLTVPQDEQQICFSCWWFIRAQNKLGDMMKIKMKFWELWSWKFQLEKFPQKLFGNESSNLKIVEKFGG